MDKKDVLKIVDHTLLTQTATWDEIRQILDDAMKYETASACIPAAYVKQAAEYVNGKLPICTVIGFPNGYNTTAVKVFETKDAIANGADEIDMVININMLKNKEYEALTNEIRQLARVCHNNKNKNGDKVILKVIVETCLLNSNEIIALCDMCIEAGADYIKTSTGFDTAGAQLEDIKMMKTCIGDRSLKIKASGGIRSLEKAKNMMNAGADRIGASSLDSQ